MTIYAETKRPAAKPQKISKEAYFLLEQRIQDLRFQVMRLAARLAHEQHSDITVAHVRDALQQIVASRLALHVIGGPSAHRFPDEAYTYLNRHLLRLHMLVTGSAAAYAQDTERREDRSLDITADHVTKAWEEVASSAGLQAILAED